MNEVLVFCVVLLSPLTVGALWLVWEVKGSARRGNQRKSDEAPELKLLW